MPFTKHQEPSAFKLQQLAITSAATSAALARKKRREKMSFNRSTSPPKEIIPTSFESVQNQAQFLQMAGKEKVPPKKRKFNHALINDKNTSINNKEDPNEDIPDQFVEQHDAAEDAIESLQLLSSKSPLKSTADDSSIRTDDASIWDVHANTLLNLSGKNNQTRYTHLPIPYTRPSALSPSPAVAIAAAAAASAVTTATPNNFMKPPTASPSTHLISAVTTSPSKNIMKPPTASSSTHLIPSIIPVSTSTPTATTISMNKPRKRSKKAVSAVEIAKAKEIRMLRNRASAAAHRQRNRNLIETLQKEVQTWKNKYNCAMDRQRELETELQLLKTPSDTNKKNIEKREQGNTKKGPVWKKLIDVFSS